MVETHAFLPRAHPLYPGARIPQPEPDEWAPRTSVFYTCPQGHDFPVVLAVDLEDKEIPKVWRCRQHGISCRQVGHDDTPLPAAAYRQRGDDGRTHYDRLRERRSIPELEVLLAERLNLLAAERTLVSASRATPRSPARRR